MIRVSKNYVLGERIECLSKIHDLAQEGKAIAFRSKKWGRFQFNIKPAAFLQNWNIGMACQYEFWTIKRNEQ